MEQKKNEDAGNRFGFDKTDVKRPLALLDPPREGRRTFFVCRRGYDLEQNRIAIHMLDLTAGNEDAVNKEVTP